MKQPRYSRARPPSRSCFRSSTPATSRSTAGGSEQLERAGYSGAFAHMLAENCEVDLHLACDLLSRGCTEQTAYSILM